MRLRRYEISAAVREQFIVAALDCVKAAARAADGGAAEDARFFAEAARTLLDSGEVHIEPVMVDEYAD